MGGADGPVRVPRVEDEPAWSEVEPDESSEPATAISQNFFRPSGNDLRGSAFCISLPYIEPTRVEMSVEIFSLMGMETTVPFSPLW